MRACGATPLLVYGSVARDEAGLSGDIDLFIDDDPAGRFNAFDLTGIKLLPEKRLQPAIDFPTRDGFIRGCVPRSRPPRQGFSRTVDARFKQQAWG